MEPEAEPENLSYIPPDDLDGLEARIEELLEEERAGAIDPSTVALLAQAVLELVRWLRGKR